jgi:hypothetical protein
MELFDYIKILFEPGKWETVSKLAKSKNHFMVNRFMSIQFPVQANELNRMGTVPSSVGDFWKQFLGKMYKSTPKWIYTKTKKPSTDKTKTKIWEPLDETLEKWYDIYNFSKKDYLNYKEFFPLELETELKEIENIIKKNK